MTEQNIVVVGGSYGGLLTTNYILRHVLPKISQNTEKYHVYLVNPSKEFFHVTASPRAILNDDLISPSQAFVDIPETLTEKYGSSIFSFIEGTVTNVDTSSRTIHYTAQDQGRQTLPYHALVLATGAKTSSPLFTTTPSIDIQRAATQDFRSRLSIARSIIIAGGGPVGVESAGEIGEYLNGTAGWFQRRPEQKTSILIVTANARVLANLREDVSARAEAYLNRVGVDVRPNTRVVSAEPNSSDPSKKGISVTLDNGDVLSADIYIPATGLKPNSSFFPTSLLTKTGHIQTHKSTLRVEGAGPRVYALGDVSSASPGGIFLILSMVPVVATNLKRDLIAAAAGKNAPDTGKDREFDPGVHVNQMVPIGRSKGVGQIFGWWVPSFLVWLVKGRDYMVSKAKEYVDGTSVRKESVWKFE